MKLAQLPDCHLSYCTNIHPGESWLDVEHALRTHLPAIRHNVSPDRPMGVGLRLSALAARELSADEEQLQAFKHWLDLENLYVYTINGFPYGAFHGRRVKEQVYQPDWSRSDRLHYSRQLARLLSVLLPEDQHGSVSTVPVGFKPDFDDPRRLRRAVDNMLQLVAYLAELEFDTGRHVQYALEPEPGCYLETTSDVVVFFQRYLYNEHAVERLQQFLPPALKSKADTPFMKRYIGVCLDTCHAAVMFERPLLSLQTLIDTGIPVHKIQLTAALAVGKLTAELKTQLAEFADGVYLHQTSVRTNGSDSRFYLDLKPALDATPENSELRSHFHVPVFAGNLGGLETTQSDLIEMLTELQRNPGCCPHLEVETYTFDVLPAALKAPSVVDNVSRELAWIQERLAS